MGFPCKRFLMLLEVLQNLAASRDYELLLDNSGEIRTQANDHERICAITNYVLEHYHEAIKLKDLSKITGLTETSCSRFFKKSQVKRFPTISITTVFTKPAFCSLSKTPPFQRLCMLQDLQIRLTSHASSSHI